MFHYIYSISPSKWLKIDSLDSRRQEGRRAVFISWRIKHIFCSIKIRETNKSFALRLRAYRCNCNCSRLCLGHREHKQLRLATRRDGWINHMDETERRHLHCTEVPVIHVLVIKQQSDINWHVRKAPIGGNQSRQGAVAVHRLPIEQRVKICLTNNTRLWMMLQLFSADMETGISVNSHTSSREHL